MCHRKYLLAILLCGVIALVAVQCGGLCAYAATLVSFTSSHSCSISVYKSSDPPAFAKHSLELVPPKDTNGNTIPIPDDNQVTFVYDGSQFTVTCDGTQANMGTPAGIEIQDKISCTVDRSGDVAPGTVVYVTLVIHDQSVYNHPYSDCPGYTVDDQLRDTSEAAPFCVDDGVNQAEACKWEEQNLPAWPADRNDPLLTQRGVPLNQWVVYARTEVTGLPLSYEANTESYPFQEGEQVCFVDVNGDGDLGQDEMASCIQTPQGYLCPIQAVQCVATYSDPICPDGGTLNPDTDKCEVDATWNCSLNSQTYSTQSSCISACVQTGTCSEQQNCTTHKCYTVHEASYTECTSWGDTSATEQCPGRRVPNGATLVGGVDCSYEEHPSRWVRYYSWQTCTTNYICSLNGHIYSDLTSCQNQCTQSGTCSSSCPSSYGYNSSTGLCEASPICQSGSYDPDQNKCYEGDTTCPLGAEYQCMAHDGISECSPNTCQEFHASNIEDDDTQQGENDKQDDGSYDASGNCLGTIYIFNGHDRRCRTAGIQTGFHNCCSGGTYWLGLAHCKGEEEQLAHMKDDGLCHYVGEYCSKKYPLVGCVQHKKTYCCFSSKLGRILQEQGRPLIASFGPGGAWGEPEGPNCRGFTPDEFQMLDFDRIDLSEWYGDITTATQSEINGTMQQGINNFYNNIQ
ncbi:MAG: conjugal transfer protein TraN [Deltaproteobacteria bacterium]|nr:conjugal transfer protein TraN [Deltaproteobacteria bacterium]